MAVGDLSLTVFLPYTNQQPHVTKEDLAHIFLL